MRVAAFAVLLGGRLCAQAVITGRVLDENGIGVDGARVEFKAADGAVAVASSDPAGNFRASLPGGGTYSIRVERAGFFVYTNRAQELEPGASQLTIHMNHQREFADRIDVTYSPPAIDPQQTSERKELTNTEIQSVPYPAPQDYRNALPLLNGVVEDNAGRVHFNGGDTNQANYTLDGFNMSDPVTGRLETRLNIDSIQTMDLENSRYSADNGRGSTGVLDVKTKRGDDRFRFGATNFIPGLTSDHGVYVNKFTPRFEFSGPIVKGRAWFYNGLDAFYSKDTIDGLPNGQNRTNSLTLSDLTRAQVNVTPGNTLTLGFLYNLSDVDHSGLSVLNPVETTTNIRQPLYMSTIRDQHYFGGALLDLGFSDTRITLHNPPLGDQIYQITPSGNSGNFFSGIDRHSYRQQEIANLFLPTVRSHGEHHLKFGIDFERESFHEQVTRHDYEVLRDDNSIARLVSFVGSPFRTRKNFEAAEYIQDHWVPLEGLALEAGVRAEWNEVVRDYEVAPRVAVAWAPHQLRDTKISAGWGIYYDAISLGTIASPNQVSLSTFYPPDGPPIGPVPTSFQVNDSVLRTPRFQTASVNIERKMPGDFYLRTGYTWRMGSQGFVFVPTVPQFGNMFYQGSIYQLSNLRRSRYDAVDFAIRRTFAGQFQWFLGYTWSSTRSNAAVDYSLENPVFAVQAPGPYQWDTPNRVHMWGWVPLPKRVLPQNFQWLFRNTIAAYLVEYRAGFPFSVVDEQGFMVGLPNSYRYPDYFNINLHFERTFHAAHYLWAWRFGYNNITGNLNPNVVNNVEGTAKFLTYYRGQARAFSVRLRLLGRK
ncbi:MAG TPA: carboxypeptidase regulatory-like domain-containing protein [Candidatus Acidoferrales bacterium]|nr:carboxypeptidase regulatory-like domain-containing protein [Candidatus Acidoferrales bacterium]